MSPFHGVINKNQKCMNSAGFSVFFDGRLDNRDELLKNLNFQEVQERPVTDEEVIVAAYRFWGPNTPRYLLGDFAIAVRDHIKQELFLARDPFGAKPLYYYSTPMKFIYGSRIPPFFQDSAVSKKPNQDLILDFLTGEYRDAGGTYFESIYQLPPAHWLHLKSDLSFRLSRYWEINPNHQIRYSNFEDYLDHYRQIFEQAVSDRLSQPGPTGFFLSGGLDSVQIVSMAEAIRQKQNHELAFEAVTLLEKGFWPEEMDALSALQQTYGTRIHTCKLWEQKNIRSGFELGLSQGETPHPDGLPTLPPLLDYLKSKGCKTVLTGYGASEYLNSYEYGYLQDLLLSLRIPKLFNELRKNTWATRTHLFPSMLALLHLSLREILPPSFFRAFRRILGKQTFLSQVLKQEVPLLSNRARQFPTLCQDQMYRAVTRPSLSFALNQMNEIGGNYGMEISHPFLDRRLIEFLLAVPSEVKMKSGYRKMFPQIALEKIVPGPVREREDSELLGVEETSDQFFKLQQERIAHHLSSDDLRVSLYVKIPFIKKMIHDNGAFSRYNLFLWRVIILENWLKDFFPDWATNKESIHERTYSGVSN